MKKRTAFAALLLALLLPCMALASEYAIVTNGKLNLRERASASSPSLGRYNGGTWIRLEGPPTGSWYPVTAPDGKRGYMSGNYLTFASSSSKATVRYASGGYVNLRSSPSQYASVVAELASGTSLTILNTLQDWYYVTATQYGQSCVGYIMSSLVNVGNSTAVVVTRNGGKVNVRSGPSFSYGTIGSLATGTQVNVLLKGTGWYWISGGGVTGFMSTSYLSDGGGYRPAPAPAPVPTAAPKPYSGGTTAWVNNPLSTQVLNLREYASQTSRSLAQYHNGKQVLVVNYGATWCQVYVDGIYGYMMTRYLRFGGVKPTAEPYVPYVPPYPGYVTAKPTATPTPNYYPELITPKPKPADPAAPTAGQDVSLVPAAGGGSAINVYNDAKLTNLKATYTSNQAAKMLQYGDYVCMVLVNGGVGYVSTANVNY